MDGTISEQRRVIKAFFGGGSLFLSSKHTNKRRTLRESAGRCDVSEMISTSQDQTHRRSLTLPAERKSGPAPVQLHGSNTQPRKKKNKTKCGRKLYEHTAGCTSADATPCKASRATCSPIVAWRGKQTHPLRRPTHPPTDFLPMRAFSAPTCK